MQIITAAVYEDLNELPANDKPNWTHERQSSLFRNLVKKHKVWQEHHALAAEIDMMRERRNDADYFAPHELHANSQAAERSLAVAGKVRAVIFQLMSENWSSQMTSVKDGKGWQQRKYQFKSLQPETAIKNANQPSFTGKQSKRHS